MSDDPTTAQRLAAEILGTAFLVFIGVGSVPATLIVNGKAPFTMADLGMISFAFGLVVVAAVYTFGHVSGCHINPAVTLGLACSGYFPWRDVPAYIASQVAGALLGAGAIVAVLGHKSLDVGLGASNYADTINWPQAFSSEFIGTFVLVFTVLGVIHRKAVPGFAGLAIGFVVFAAIIPTAPITGGAINPARYMGAFLVEKIWGPDGALNWSQVPVYLISELLAGAVAAGIYILVFRTAADGAPSVTAERDAVSAQ